MKYRLTFYSPDHIELPIQYNHILQAALLNWIGEKEYTEFLHDSGFQVERRQMKLYTFSNLYGRYQYHRETRKICFSREISFCCSFYEDQENAAIERNILGQKPLRLGEKKLAFISCEKIEEEFRDCIVETLSPVTIHSTVTLPDGRRRTYYYEPHDPEFSLMIKQNLVRKYKAFYGVEPENTDFEIRCLENEMYKKANIYYQRFVITGWRGRFALHGSEEMIKMALLAGIGARNGIGCGCVIVA